MPSFVIYQLDTDPLGAADVDVVAGFTVDIIDNDDEVENPDGDGTPQFDVSGIPGLTSSTSFEAFESYDGTVGGLPVTFTLIQFSGTPYMFVTSGVVAVGDTIDGPSVTSFSASSNEYDDLPSFVCFADGTQIATRWGPVAVEDLQVGDEVLTMDNGYQHIQWAGSCLLGAADLGANPNLRPIRIQAGALGPDLPQQDLLVSPQHRVLVRSIVAQRMFDTSEILVPANKLTDLNGIDIDQEVTSVIYNHFLLERHEIVFSNGAPTESLFTGSEALKSVGKAARDEIAMLFPELVSGRLIARPARPIHQKRKLINRLVARVKKNNKSIIEPAF